jgi:hypothetical protein
MGEFIKKTSQAGGSKRKETHIAHKRFRDETKRKLEEREKIIEEKESKYLKKKFKSKYITEKTKKEKEEDKKEEKEKKEDKIEYIKKIERVDVNTGGLVSGFPKLATKGWK